MNLLKSYICYNYTGHVLYIEEDGSKVFKCSIHKLFYVTFWLTVLLSRHYIRVRSCVPVTRHGDALVCLASLPMVPGPVGAAGPPSTELTAGPPAGHLTGHLAILWIQSVGVDIGARPGWSTPS